MTWKVSSGGRATFLVVAGEFGDWRSKAVLSHIDESQVDASRVLLDSIEASDDEGEGGVRMDGEAAFPSCSEHANPFMYTELTCITKTHFSPRRFYCVHSALSVHVRSPVCLA